MQALSKSCIGRSGVMDERDTCGRCGRNTSWCVVREYFFGMEDFCFQIGLFVMNEKWFSPIIDQMQLGDQGSLQNERSKQSLHTEECMLYSGGKGGEKLRLLR